MLILGATGPWDAAKRRPWIDWIHTASDQGALVRGYTKWDNQPGVGAGGVRRAPARGADGDDGAARSDLRQPRRGAAGGEARRSAAAAGPVAVRRARVAAARARADRARGGAARRGAAAPVILVGRDERTMESWRARVGARGEARRPRDHRPQDRRELPDAPSAARRPARHLPLRGGRRARCARPTSSSRSTGSTWPARSSRCTAIGRSRRKIVSASCDVHVAPRLQHGLLRLAAGRRATSSPSRTSRCRCSSRRAGRASHTPPRRAAAPRPDAAPGDVLTPAGRRRGSQRGDRRASTSA